MRPMNRRSRHPCHIQGGMVRQAVVGAAWLGPLLALVLAAAPREAGCEEPAGGPDLALTELGFSAADIVAARAGSVVSRQVPQADDSAAFAIGMARVVAPDDRIVGALRNIDTFRTGGR